MKPIDAIKSYFKYVNSSVNYLSLVDKEGVNKYYNTSLARKDVLIKNLSTHPEWDSENLRIPFKACINSIDDDLFNNLFSPLDSLICNIRDYDYSLDIQKFIIYNDPKYIPDELKKFYHKGRKVTRILRDFCKFLGLDEMDGFEAGYAKVSDYLSHVNELTTLYLSVHPMDFVTMSNPMGDSRGETLTSCHSLNHSRDGYNGGCTGYGMDEVTMIVYAAKDKDRFNRKTIRQLFMYNEGYLIQSRLYNSIGGTNNSDTFIKNIRQGVQEIISKCYGLENQWSTRRLTRYLNDNEDSYLEPGCYYIGYRDWEYSSFGARISINKDVNSPLDMLIGGEGVCLSCGNTTKDHEMGMVCDCCFHTCDKCDGVTNNTSSHIVDGEYMNLCNDCFDSMTICTECGNFTEHPRYVDEEPYCHDCFTFIRNMRGDW